MKAKACSAKETVAKEVENVEDEVKGIKKSKTEGIANQN